MAPPTKKLRTRRIDEMFRSDVKKKPDHAKQVAFDMSLMKMLCGTNMRFEIVQSESFVNLTEFMEYTYTLQSPATYYDRYLPKLYEEVKAAAKAEFEDQAQTLPGICFNVTRNGDMDIADITANYIADDFELRSYVVGTIKAVESSNPLDSVVSELSRKRKDVITLKWCVSDAGLDASKTLQLNHEHATDINCAVHALNLVVTKAVAECTLGVKSAIEKLFKLGETCESWPIGWQLNEACKDVGIFFRPVSVPYDIDDMIEWPDRCTMFTSILHMREALENLAGEKEITLPDPIDFEIVEKILPILNKVSTLIELLTEEGEHEELLPTVHKMIPQLYNGDQCLTCLQVPQNPEYLREFLENLRKNLRHYYPELGQEVSEFAMAHMLDPAYKGALLKETGKFDSIQKMIVDTIEDGNKAGDSVKIEGSSEVSDAYETDFSHRLLQKMTLQKKKVSEIEQELTKYLDSPLAEQGVDVLKWWKRNAAVYPRLASLARSLYCIPSSCTRPTKKYSGEDETSTENSEMIVFIRQNLPSVRKRLNSEDESTE